MRVGSHWAHLIPWKLFKFFFPVRMSFQQYWIIVSSLVAMARQGWSFCSYYNDNIFFSLVISAKIVSKKVLILFGWTFLLQMWNHFPLVCAWLQRRSLTDNHNGQQTMTTNNTDERWWTTIRMDQDNDWWLTTMHHHQDGPRQWKTTDDDQLWQQWTTTINDQQWMSTNNNIIYL